jgi:hypothetical protein
MLDTELPLWICSLIAIAGFSALCIAYKRRTDVENAAPFTTLDFAGLSLLVVAIFGAAA